MSLRFEGSKFKKLQPSHHPPRGPLGLTFIDILVGISLMLIVFLGIFGVYQLGLKVVGVSKNRITAAAIANGEIEKIRNLPYPSVGTKEATLPFAQGILDSVTTTIKNNVEYKIETQVKYIIDEADGTGAQDSCNWDYKRAEIKVSWSGRFPGEVKLVTDVAPKNKVEEINTCTAQPGGIISVTVFDAYGKWEEARGAPLIEVFNPTTGERVDFFEPLNGKHNFPLVSSTYKVVVSKSGYSTERTYDTQEIATPENPHLIVLEGQSTEISFSIDRLSAFSVDTLSPWGIDYFSDIFSDTSKISQSSNITVEDGKVNLLKIDDQYQSPGYLTSATISPTDFLSWQEFSFSDEEPPDTQILYQVLYFDGENWVLIPDSDLPENSIGFGTSQVNLSNLNINTYSQLRFRGNLSTQDVSLSPTLYDWQVSWKTSESTPIPNATFHLQGSKIIGLDANENPVYKFSAPLTSDSNGKVIIPNLEWDNYTFSVNPTTNLDLVSTDPSSQPISLNPDTNLAVKLYLDSQNSLLVTVQDSETLESVFSAQVRLYKSGYDKTQYTNEKGQTYFIPLVAANYNLDVSAPGYSSTSTTVSVSGDNTKTIKLEQVE